jgi:2-dehydropantoate 2-reductase
MPFKKIMVAGAGAIGSVIAARLALAGREPTVLARGRTLQVLQHEGLRLHDLSGEHHVRVTATDDASTGVQDLIFVCAKAGALPDMMAQLRPAIGAHTTIVPGVNGIPWWYFQREGGRFDNEGW